MRRDLAEGWLLTDGAVRLISNVVDCPWEEVEVGMPVSVVFDDVAAEVSLPKFVPSVNGKRDID